MGLNDLVPEHPIEDGDYKLTEENFTDEEIYEYVAGMFDGDGTVGIYPKRGSRYTVGYSMSVYLDIVQSYHSDRSYIAGFTDSDGSIMVGISKVDWGDIGYKMRTEIELGQTVSISLIKFGERLNNFCNNIGCDMNVQFKKEDKDGHRDRVKFHTHSLDNIEKFLEGIRPYSVIKHEQTEIMLNEIIPRMRNEYHLNKRGFVEIMEWRDKMNSLKGGNRGKYDADYFRDLWEDELDNQLPAEGFL